MTIVQLALAAAVVIGVLVVALSAVVPDVLDWAPGPVTDRVPRSAAGS